MHSGTITGSRVRTHQTIPQRWRYLHDRIRVGRGRGGIGFVSPARRVRAIRSRWECWSCIVDGLGGGRVCRGGEASDGWKMTIRLLEDRTDESPVTEVDKTTKLTTQT